MHLKGSSILWDKHLDGGEKEFLKEVHEFIGKLENSNITCDIFEEKTNC